MMEKTYHSQSMRFEAQDLTPAGLTELLLPWTLWKKGLLVLREGVSAADIMKALAEPVQEPSLQEKARELVSDFAPIEPDDFEAEEEFPDLQMASGIVDPAPSLEEIQSLAKQVREYTGGSNSIATILKNYGVKKLSALSEDQRTAIRTDFERMLQA